jgi:hypothetical protein
MEAIAFICDDDWEKAMAMESDTDYEIRYVDNYSPGEHRVLGGHIAYKSGLAAFAFVKLKNPKHLH